MSLQEQPASFLSEFQKNPAKFIDHTLLKESADTLQIESLCEEARTHHFATVCVRPNWVKLAHQKLAGSAVLAITVIGFPSGGYPDGKPSLPEKLRETEKALADGAQETDLVINRRALYAKDYRTLHEEVESVVKLCGNIPVKVILETSELSDIEKITACAISKNAGAAFVKTSTGFSKSGATVSDITLMRNVVGLTMGVKASGGIRDRATAELMVKSGANRIGTSSGVLIVSTQSSADS